MLRILVDHCYSRTNDLVTVMDNENWLIVFVHENVLCGDEVRWSFEDAKVLAV